MKKLAFLILFLASFGLAQTALASCPNCTPQVDLELVSLTATNPVSVGSDLTYTVVVRNNGPDKATNVTVLANPITGGMVYKSAGTAKNGVPEARTCQYASHQNPAHDEVGCPIQELDVGETATTTIVISPTAVGTLHSRLIAIPDWNTVDPDLGSSNSNNVAESSVTVLPEEADLEVTMRDNPDPATVFEDLSYAITVKNIGASTAKNIEVTDNIPGYATYKTSTIWLSNGNCQISQNVLHCTLDDLASGDKAIIQVIVTPYKENITIHNTAYATTSTLETVTINNRTDEDTQIHEATTTPPPPPPPAGVCGDGQTVSPEACDDGNATDGDGCDSHCQIETPPPPTTGGGSGGSTGSGGADFGDNSGASNVPQEIMGAGEPGHPTAGEEGPKDLLAVGHAEGGGCACAINQPDGRGFNPVILGLAVLAMLPVIALRLTQES